MPFNINFMTDTAGHGRTKRCLDWPVSYLIFRILFGRLLAVLCGANTVVALKRAGKIAGIGET